MELNREVLYLFTQNVKAKSSNLDKFMEIFHNLSDKNKIPRSGLNFLLDNNFERNFLLLCGFEKFKQFL